MRRSLWQFGKLFRKSTPKRTGLRKPTPALRLETLEDRTMPSANASGMIVGNAFIDNNASGVFNQADFGVPGVAVFLNGTTSATGKTVSQSTTTNGSGAYSFLNVLPGTYTVSYSSVSNIQGDAAANNPNAPGTNILASGLQITGGQVLTNNIGFGGLTAPAVNLLPFFTFSSGFDSQFAAAGLGANDVNFRSNSSPFFTGSSSSTINGSENGSNVIDLSGSFNDPDIQNGTTVQFVTTDGTFDVELFDQQAEQTVANFLDYVESGDYNTSIFHRLVDGFVIQGGGFKLPTTTVTQITPLPAVPSEATASLADGNSNTIGTLAVALPGSDPNGGTDNFFINLSNNNSSTASSTSSGTNLDAEDFTVFGTVVGGVGTGTVVSDLASATPTNESNANGAFSQIPLTGTPSNATSGQTGFTANDPSFPGDATASNFDEIISASIVPGTQNEQLSYQVLNNSDPALVTPVLSGATDNYLTLNYATGKTGSATIEVEATDMFGATATGTFTVNVGTPAPVVSGATISTSTTSTGTVLTANATITDSNGDTTFPNTTYQWFETPAGSTTPVAVGSATTSNTLNLSGLTVTAGEQFTVAVTPVDGTTSGTTFTSKSVTIGSPSATITNLSIAPNSTTDATSLTVTPTSPTDPNGAVSFTYQWFQNGTAISTTTAPSAATNTLVLSQLSSVNANDTFTVDVTPSDVLGAGATAISNAVTIATTTVVNTSQGIGSPTAVITNLSVAPDNATDATSLTVTPTSPTDPNGAVNYTYQWFQNNTAINPTTAPSAATATLDLSQITVNPNDTFIVEVTPSDTTGTGPTVTSVPETFTTATTVAGTQPVTGIGSPSAVITSLSVAPNNTGTDATSLTVTPTSTDSAGDTVSFAYQWFQNGTAISSTTAASATTATLNLSQITVNQGDTFTVQVTPSDANGTGAAITSQPVTASSTTTVTGGQGVASTGTALAPPAVVKVTLSDDSPTNTTQLTATAAGNDDGLGTTYTYSWTLTGSNITGGSATVGTGQTLALGSLTLPSGNTVAANDTFSVTVTPSTGTAFTSAALPVTITLSGTTPVYSVTSPTVNPVTITSSTTAGVTTLTATPTGTAAGPLDFTYQWMQNGTAIPGATSSTLVLDTPGLTANLNDAFAVQVTPITVFATQGIGTPSAVITGLTVAPNSTTNATSLTVTPASTDSAGDTVSFTYQWFQNGTAISSTTAASATTATLDLTQLTVNPNDKFTVQVTPSDANGAGAVVTSQAVTIDATTAVTGGQGIASPSPLITGLTVAPDSTTNATSLTVTPTSSDAAGDTVKYTYQWFENGTAINAASATTATLELSQLGAAVAANDKFTVAVIPSDATGTGPTATSAAVTFTSPTAVTGSQGIGTPSAVITNLSIAPNSTTNATSLTVTPTPADSAGATVNFTYQWFQNGTAISSTTAASATTATLNLTQITVNKGDKFTVQVTPSDTNGAGAAITSQPVTVSTVTTVTGGQGIGSPTAVITTLSVAQNTVTNPTTLTVTPTSADATANNISYTYQWFQNGTAIPTTTTASATTATLNLSQLTVSPTDKFTVQVTPSDANGAGPAVTSLPATPLATPIIVAGASVSSNDLFVTATNPLTLS